MTEHEKGSADPVLAHVLGQRERHRARAMPVRAVVVAAGALVSVFGVILLIEPEFGLPIMLVGLRLLAYEFDWAARLYARVARWWERLRARYKQLSPAKKYAGWIAAALVVALVVVWFIIGR